MGTGKRYPQELRERAVRLVDESRTGHEFERAAISSVASKIGCTHETPRRW
jgi:transposase